jgi:hypothetical protein
MVDRWSVERAVRDPTCTLDPPGRQLVLTLLTWSDYDTAMIPERFTPSLTDLVNATGLARSTVAAWLNKLEEQGWVVRERPTVAAARSRKARTVYSLRVPAGPLSGLVRTRASSGDGPVRSNLARRASPRGGLAGSDSSASAGPAGGPGRAGASPARGLALVRQSDASSPPDGLNPYREQDLPVGGRGSFVDHRYVAGPNGRCTHEGCTRSAPLHSRAPAGEPPREGEAVRGEDRTEIG